jgi:hypothetical protein
MDYFRAAGIADDEISPEIRYEAAHLLTFQPFPIESWPRNVITEEHIFEALEFLYICVAKPGRMFENCIPRRYETYDESAGQHEFRTRANQFLADYKTGFELAKDGTILAVGAGPLQHILDAAIVPYDEKNVDRKVQNAIAKWRNRRLSQPEQKEAIRELADVFEWLKKTKDLSSVLDSRDESAIFDIAYSARYRTATNLVLLSPDVAEHFPDEQTVNAALRGLIRGEKDSHRRTR